MAADVNLDANESVALDKLEVTTDIPIEETTVSQAFDAGEEINQLGRVSYSKVVKIDGTDYRLYPEFEDPEHAVNELEKAAKNGMDYLRTTMIWRLCQITTTKSIRLASARLWERKTYIRMKPLRTSCI